ncbi:13512_t:CDS:1, partial [Racocetra persica]
WKEKPIMNIEDVKYLTSGSGEFINEFNIGNILDKSSPKEKYGLEEK